MAAGNDALRLVQSAAHRLLGPDDVGPILAAVGDAPLVLLGEATHGSHEFYRLRAELSKRLIRERGFDALAVEADWPDALRISRFIRGHPDVPTVDAALAGFVRFPRWMWRNEEIRALVRWLHAHNAAAPAAARVGFYGLDLYNLGASIEAVIRFLERTDPAAAERARARYRCFDSFVDDPQSYGMAANFGLSPDCSREVVQQLRELFDGLARPAAARDDDERFYAQQSARVVRDAERYYRTMFGGPTDSWNLRDTHMAETLGHLRAHLTQQRGRPARIVVWAHNSHVGDARATESGDHGQLNLGQLAREGAGGTGDVFLLGFTTHDGTVAAADDWDGPLRIRQVRPSRRDSFEGLFHATGLDAFMLPLVGAAGAALTERRLERAIGVIYRPDTERLSHYFHAALGRQFDAVVHFDRTRALTPLDAARAAVEEGEPETFPTGM